MQLHDLKPKHKSKKRKRIGRGGKRGTYSGRGIKGQKSRAGHRLQPAIRQWLKRYPKLRGYRFKSHREKPAILNLDILEEKFESGDIVSPQILVEKKIVAKKKGKVPQIKILGKGELKKKLEISGCQFSKTAQEKIKKAGSEIIVK